MHSEPAANKQSISTENAITVLIVDDEHLARERLKRFISGINHCKVIGEAENGIQAIDLFSKLAPDILLLDIRMPSMTGIEVAQHLSRLDHRPAIIFCTAYDDYALEAFKVNAVDYLVKPVRLADLENAILKASSLNRAQLNAMQLQQQELNQRSHLSVTSHRGLELIPVSEIRCFRAEQKYVAIVTDQGEWLVDEPLKQLEKEFVDQFLRIHRNALIAIRYVERLERTNEGQQQIYLQGLQQPLKISRRHLSEVKKHLRRLII
ncbi:LytR/AlgR family response regulator transcription factor [Gynuella sp.]|uniref:LytR/AlgR family response regulator transcription factor n=1 Tax=Gynuella sp. TaxID=2969146 RepID=UPI003D0BE4AB